MLERYVKKILAARVYDVAQVTPLVPLPVLSDRLGAPVIAKREDLQPVFSFKLRGSYNKMAGLSPEVLKRGVVTASAGNHAQGVALAAKALGCKASIVMGRNTPSIKVDAVKRHGGKVILHGDTYDDAAAHARELVEARGLTYIHPYDDADVIAGQGTVGMEILNQHSGALDAVYVPVGGGGLISGIAAYLKYLRPEVRVVGVEAEGSACLSAALAAGRRVRLPYETLDLFADGVSVAQIGKETFRVCRKYVDEVVTVTTDEICAAIKDLYDDMRSIAEPAGALSLAGLKKVVEARGPQGPAIAVVSGANVNFDRLRHISERAEVGEHREVVLGVTIPERPGSFRRFCRTLGKRSVTEFNYRRASADAAHVYVGAQVSAPEDGAKLIQALTKAGYAVEDMTLNETAKLHVRHMVGGRSSVDAERELLYRFEFPERPGALMRFLNGLGARWNITLFHYRNHGAAWGRVLVGFEGGPDDRAELADFLKRIGYRYWEESGNAAYRLFLS